MSNTNKFFFLLFSLYKDDVKDGLHYQTWSSCLRVTFDHMSLSEAEKRTPIGSVFEGNDCFCVTNFVLQDVGELDGVTHFSLQDILDSKA